MTDSNSAPFPHWRRNINLFLAGQFLSGITSMIVQYAIIWYLTRETGSASMLSFATILGMIPMVVLSPFVGPLVDRWNKKLTLMLTDIFVACFALVLAIVGTVSPTFPLWLVFISLFMRALAQTFQMPILMSILPTMVPQDYLTKVNGQVGMIQSANFIIAPALSAFLFARMPMNFLILFDVLGAIVGVGLLLMIVIPKVSSQGEEVHLLKDAKFGFSQLFHNKGLWYLTLIGTLLVLFTMPAFSMYPLMTLGYFNREVGDAGIVEVIFSTGALASSAFLSSYGKWKNRVKPIVFSFIVMGLMIGASGLLPPNSQGFFTFLVLNAVFGFAHPFFNTMWMAMIQQSYEPSVLGRVMGVLSALLNVAGPIGLIFAGPLADRIGVEKMFIIAGISCLICAMLTLIIPQARNYDIELQKKLSIESEETQ